MTITADPTSETAVPRTATDRVQITFLVDASGSMASQKQGVIDGFNAFLAEQQDLGGDCRVTLAYFTTKRNGPSWQDSQLGLDVVIDNEEINVIEPISKFHPSGGTPLFDATAEMIARTDDMLADLVAASTPVDHTLFIVFTDGYENSSVEFNKEQLAELTKQKEDAGWTFIYLGANHDVSAQAGAMGVAAKNMTAYDGNDAGTRSIMHMVSRATTNLRGGAYQAGHTVSSLVADAQDEEIV